MLATSLTIDTMQAMSYLKPADQVIRDIIFEQLASLVVLAAPSPHVLTVAILSALVENASADAPHDDTEDEKGHGKRGIVDSYLFGALMTTTPPGVKYTDSHEKGDAGNDEDGDLRPHGCVLGPWWKIVSRRDGLGRIEDGKGSCHHRKHDETAAEIDAA